MAKRKLVIQDQVGRQLFLTPEIDLSDLPNADARSPLVAVVSEKCDCCGTWNQIGRVELPHWDDTNFKAYYQRMADYRDRTPVA